MEVAVQTTNFTSQRALDDYTVVKQAIKGDQRSYAILLERYRSPIFHMMMKMVNNREDADDLTIEAFGKAFAKLSSYAPRYAFSTWLFRIAINNGIDYIRKKRLQMLSIDDPIAGESSSDYSGNIRSANLDPEQAYIRKQRLGMMREMLTRLNGKYRLMIGIKIL